jgi:hypothetical protein
MPVDVTAASQFVWSVARLVDRHRFAMLFGDGPPDAVLAALAGYRNADGGFGHALEPDLRCPMSQPAATLYALEMLVEAGAGLDGELARGARRWLASIAEPDGGIPSVLPGFEDYPHTFWWAPQPGSSLTFALAAVLHEAGVGDDGWLDRVTAWCWRALEAPDAPAAGYWLKHACAFLDAVADEERALAALAALRSRGAGATIAVTGGIEGEALHALDLSPRPGSRSRALVEPDAVAAHLDAVEDGQQEDGGWTFDWLAWSPAQISAWRGNVTIRALVWLRDHSRGI